MTALAGALGASGGIVCAVGAGGKKSVVYALAREASGRVGLTATVHTAPFPRGLGARVLVDDEAALRSRVPESAGDGLLAYACPSGKRKRLAGVSPETVAAVHAEGAFDLTLVKADGARMRGIKAPKPGEPVLPPGAARVLLVVSAGVIGAPLDERTVHRPERLAALVDAEPGALLTVENVARLLTAPDGGLQGTAGLPVTLVINQVDDDERRQAAAELARLVLAREGGPERAVVTCLRAETPVVAAYDRDTLW